MAKRFTDTEIWRHPWFHALPPKMKLAWRYLCDECDGCGVWRVNIPFMEFQIGERITAEELREHLGSRLLWITSDKVWIPSFIGFQYKNLKATNSAQRGIMRKIIELTQSLPLDEESSVLVSKFKELVGDNSTLDRPSTESQPTLSRPSVDSTGNGYGNGNDSKKGDVGGNKPAARFDFDALYKKYPRKEGKSGGIAKCKAQIKTPEDYADLQKAIERYSAHCAREGKEKQYIKHFSTFMSSWRDWLEPETGTVLPLQSPVFRQEMDEESRRFAELRKQYGIGG